MRVSVVRSGAAWGLGVILGCSTDAFLCETDEGCLQAGAQGVCQPSGYCSFPDETCPSGQRYGQHASDVLANTCVEPGAVAESGGTTELGEDATTTTSGPTTLTTAPMTTEVDGPATTEPVDPSQTSTGPAESTGGMADDEPGTTTAAPELVCWTDDFEDGVIDQARWCPWADPGFAVDETRGDLRVQLLPAEWGMGGATGGASTCDPFPLVGAAAAVEVVGVPQVSTYTEAYIEMGREDRRLGLGILNAELYAFTYDGMGYAGFAFQPYLPEAHRWLRIVGTDEGLVAEASPDGVAWAFVYELPGELVGDEGTSSVGAWGQMAPLGPDAALFERFEQCWLQG